MVSPHILPVMSKPIVRLSNIRLDPEKYYILLSAGCGDTLVYLGLRRYMEQRWGGTFHFLIRRSHEVIMKMYGVDDYDVLDFAAEGFSGIACDRLTAISDQTPRLRKGAVWVAFFGNHRELDPRRAINRQTFRMRNYFEYLLQIPSSCWDYFERPKSDNITVSTEFMNRVSQLGQLSQMVLLIPECGDKFQMTREIDAYWEKEIAEYARQGLKVIINALHPFPLKGAIHLNMSLEEALWLGLNCHSIHALRSGFCDLLAFFRGKDMTVVYKDHWGFYQFNFNDLFNLSIKEKIVIPPVKKTPPPPPEPFKTSKKTYMLFGAVRVLTVHKISPERTRYYFLGIPVVSIYFWETTRKINFFGVTVWKTLEN